ncbi:hypothetical protein [Actinotalea fermentans]|uniref:DUF4232 domain-containing protein n=1 Tax=Actinotalea fermentans TaxID=43671 RepID=A0A511Z0J1_9CELL|nr:hypothetical protein [Actinotalea fermentans]KGM15047.1 hypothetical protein N867_12610 [Actinotalea fermentans ATCC 43279 = JCM 9966 = DSM 3133]GEN80981.1 hypothetical protein AFE02nite_27150 [Actinotalea fermentans]
MSTVLRGLEPQPRWVYWIRRAVVALAALLVLVLIWAIFLRGDGGSDEPTDPAAEPAVGETEAADAPDTSDTTASRACAAGDLQLALTSDATSYAPGATPTFAVTLTNAADSSCTVDAGNASVEVVVTSGSDRIWSSLDCAVEGAEGAERMLLLATGAQEAASVPWARVRSDATCSSGLPEPRAGTYHAKATLVGAESNDLVFTLE